MMLTRNLLTSLLLLDLQEKAFALEAAVGGFSIACCCFVCGDALNAGVVFRAEGRFREAVVCLLKLCDRAWGRLAAISIRGGKRRKRQSVETRHRHRLCLRYFCLCV